MRVHELAKELGMTSKDLMAQLHKLGAKVKNHMAPLEEKMVARFRQGARAASAPKPAKSAAKPRAAGRVKSAAQAPAAKIPKKAEKPKAPPAGEIKAPPPVKAPAAATPPEPKEKERPKEAPKRPQAAQPVSAAPTPAPAPPVPAVAESPKAAPVSAPIAIRFPITVGNLAVSLKISVSELIKQLMALGIFANINQLLNDEIVVALGRKLGIAIQAEPDEVEEIFQRKRAPEEDPRHLKLRPPVVTMMGHVDHGKTSLLDVIRKTNVAATEKGAITQHIGAYGVDIPGRGHVTFIDTPGHEAFTAMRARGANVTDVVVLVVAADDGVMPQTVEAVDHAREARCPIVVAINKSDLPAANPQKVMTGLQKIELVPEEWGGKTICVKVSAKTGKGIEELLEMLLLEAEVLELKANADSPASGTVIESHLSKGSGPIATVIVQRGTLRIGDIVVCGPFTGRVRALRNDRGKVVKEAGPSYAVEVSGLSGVPEAGETFAVVADDKVAKKITEKRMLKDRELQMSGASKHLSLEELYERISKGNFKELKMIIKADVQGSVEALAQSLEKLSTDQCRVRVIHGGVGGVNESDVMLAAASDAVIVGFNVKADAQAEELSAKEGVNLRFYNIIYEAVEEVRKAMEGLLEPSYQEVVEGRVQVRKIFKSKKAGTIAGCMVVKGKVLRSHRIRVIRNNVVVYEGKLTSLRHFQDDVREVQQGYECGLVLENFEDVREGDAVESYRLDRVAAKL